MLVCSILILAYSILQKRADQFDMRRFTEASIGKKSRKLITLSGETIGTRLLLFSFLNGIILASVILSGSRAGLIIEVTLLVMAWIGELADRRLIVVSIVL